MRTSSSSRFYSPAEDSREMRYLQRTPRRRSAAACRRAGARRRRSRCRRSTATRASRSQADGKEMSTTMAVVRLLERPAEGQGARAAHRADRRRRGAHVRHGEPVPPDRHLFAARPALRARGRGLDAVLPRGAGRPAARGGHHRSRRALVVDRGRHLVQRARRCRCCRSTSTTRCSASSASAT